ncbi:MAG: hypothetical protein M4579_006525 [Chaenotheca gracillima]|nr:MAG: hypothetical protein M4579_006525 [Chaenotheca gracillima]
MPPKKTQAAKAVSKKNAQAKKAAPAKTAKPAKTTKAEKTTTAKPATTKKATATKPPAAKKTATPAATKKAATAATKKAAANKKATKATITGAGAKKSATPAAKAPTTGRGRAKKATPAAATTTESTSTEPTSAEPTSDAKVSAPPHANEPNKGVKRKAAADPSTVPGPAAKKQRPLPKINEPPTKPLHVYVFGEGSAGELGLGASKKAVDVKRPRLNPNLSAEKVGVVQVAVGGMHCLALTRDNKILSWGVNDQGSLGRDTNWEGGFKEMKEGDASGSDSDDESDSGINPRESTPAEVVGLPEHEVWAQVAAGDSCSFALTTSGLVYGWGTFRGVNGVMGFRKEDVTWTQSELRKPLGDRKRHVLVQRDPILISELRKVTQIACGANHVLALDASGNVFAWGAGEQFQLGRKLVERHVPNGLVPRQFGLPRGSIAHVSCGSDHSLAIDKAGNVWGWGLNGFGECGVREGAGDEENFIMSPALAGCLVGREVQQADGGSHHSTVIDKDGGCLVWGRVDGNQLGLDIAQLGDEDFVLDEDKRRRILKTPTRVADFEASMVSAANDTTIAITTDGRAWSWGFSVSYQTGLGTSEDVVRATLVDNTAVRNKRLNWAGVGGQFGVLTALAGPEGEREPPS